MVKLRPRQDLHGAPYLLSMVKLLLVQSSGAKILIERLRRKFSPHFWLEAKISAPATEFKSAFTAEIQPALWLEAKILAPTTKFKSAFTAEIQPALLA